MGAQWKAKGKKAEAKARGRLFAKLAKDIMIAARSGPDPAMNPKLRMAIDAARKQSMPKNTLERAIKKGAGLLGDVTNYESVTYEGYGPHQVPVIVECLTDNKNRTAPNMRVLFRKGQLGSSGSVSWDFDRLGAIEAMPPEEGDDAEEAAIECGAQDLENLEDEEGEPGPGTRFLTEPTELDAVGKELAARGWSIESQKLVWAPKNPVSLEGDAQAEIEAFLAAIDDDEDVHEVYPGLA